MVSSGRSLRSSGIQAFWREIHPGMRRLIAIGMVEVLSVGLYVSLLAAWWKSLGYESVARAGSTQSWK